MANSGRMDPRDRYNELDEAIIRVIEGWMASVHTALPATIQKHDLKQNTVDALSALKMSYVAYDGKQTWVPMPKLSDTPIFYPSGGGVTLTLPVQKDDEGLLVFASRTIDKWWKDGAKQEPQIQTDARMHDFADAFMFPGFRSQPNALQNVSEKTMQIRTNDGKTNFDFNPQNGGQMTMTAPNNPTTVNGKGFDTNVQTSNLTSSGTTTVKSTGDAIKLNSPLPVDVANDLKAHGKIDASGGFFQNGTPIGGGSGGGGTGPPGPQGPAGPPGPAGVYLAGPGIQIDTSTDPDTINNIGVTSLIAGTGITISGATGNITISAPGSGGTAAVFIGDTPPTSPTTGTLWFDSVQADLYIRYTDQDTSQWVPVVSGPSAGTTTFVNTFNTRIGDVVFTAADLTSVGGAFLTTRLDQFAAPNVDVPWNSHKITGLLDPTNPQDATTKAYVDSAVNFIAGAGLTKTGNTFDVGGTANRIVVNTDSVDIAATYVGQTSITTLGTVSTGAWNGSVIGVAYGGSGASTLTGYLKGNGTSPFTGVATIPNTDITGLGTMSVQNANAVAITGGTAALTGALSVVGATTLALATATTPATSDNSQNIATTAFVKAQGFLTGGPYLPLSGGVLTGQLNFSGPNGVTTHIFDDGASHIEADGTLWINGNTAADVRIGGSVFLSKNLSVTGITTLGNASGVTVATADNSTSLATTAFVKAAISGATAGVSSFNTRTGAVTLTSADITGAGGALLASPSFTGVPLAPTAATATNTTQIATTAFVKAQNYVTGGPYLPIAGGQTTGSVAINTTIPPSSYSSSLYSGLLVTTAVAVNLYRDTANSQWLRLSATGTGGVANYDINTNSFFWYTAPNGAVNSAATITQVGALTNTGALTTAGPIGAGNIVIPAGGHIGSVYAEALSIHASIGHNLYVNAANTQWLRRSATGSGGVFGYDWSANQYVWYTAPAGAQDSVATVTLLMTLTSAGAFQTAGPIAAGSITIPSNVNTGHIFAGPVMVSHIASNLYLNAANTAWLRKTGTGTGAVIQYDNTGNQFNFLTAVAGAADSSVASFTNVMSLTSVGALTVANAIANYTLPADHYAYSIFTNTLTTGQIGFNLYLSSGAQWVRYTGSNTGGVFQYDTVNNAFSWLTSPAGAVNSAATFGTAATLTNGGIFTAYGAVYSAGIIRTVGASIGYAWINPGTASNSGYFATYNAAGTRLFYLGWDATQPALNIDVGGQFVINGGNLNVTAGAVISGGANGSYIFYDRTVAGHSWTLYATGDSCRLYYNNVGDMCSWTTGNVMYSNNILDYSNNAHLVGNTGNAYANVVSYSFANASARQDKADIEDVPSVLPILDKLSPKTYRWNHGPDTEKRHHGFIAEEVAEVMGEDWGGFQHDENGHHALRYNELTAVLWKAVQELTARVAELEAR